MSVHWSSSLVFLALGQLLTALDTALDKDPALETPTVQVVGAAGSRILVWVSFGGGS